MGIPRRQLWPYDEVKISGNTQAPGEFTVSSPWIKFSGHTAPEEGARIFSLAEKMAGPGLDASDFENTQWLFQSLSKYPLSYILPRADGFGFDDHQTLNPQLNASSPVEMLKSLCQAPVYQAALERFVRRTGEWRWTWDLDAALGFSQTHDRHDPESLFSIARRFHLLNDIEWNKTGEMLEYVRGLKDNKSQFEYASALIIRQNHYITEQCESVLKSALPLSQNAREHLNEFIQAESGHDKILAKALKSVGTDASVIPAIDTVIVLMEVFREVAKRNFLAFSMIVDIFERTSYQEDPLANVLRAGGLDAAARAADVHRDINDSGGHENLGITLLGEMAPVDAEYAREAMMLAELATLTIHQLSAETLEVIRASV